MEDAGRNMGVFFLGETQSKEVSREGREGKEGKVSKANGNMSLWKKNTLNK